MKKILLLALVAAMGGGLRAQDTVWQEAAPLNNYFYNNWVDTSNVYFSRSFTGGVHYVIAKRFITDDTLRVYGIAAMMANPDLFWYTPNSQYPTIQSQLADLYPEDPTFDNCRESLLLYQYHGPDTMPAMIQLGDSLPVHYIDTPVTYWMKPNGLPRPPQYNPFDTISQPVYERYFSAPQTVLDTFYVGFTQGHSRYDKDSARWFQIRPAFEVFAFGIGGGMLDIGFWECDAKLGHYRNNPVYPLEWTMGCHQLCAPFIFPILTPEPLVDTTVIPIDTTVIPVDTTINPGDTTAVVSPEVMRRYVAVQPNPAHERMSVTSSFGLTAIEVYDSRGRQLFSAPASGFKVTLDISSWPRGTYLLRIFTPFGPTTRKVIVQ